MTNACFLMGAFMLVVLKMTADEAYERFREYDQVLVPFRDASKGECAYKCTVYACLQGLEFALK
jgi:cell division cycle 14